MEEEEEDTKAIEGSLKQVTCQVCGLTARTKQELDDHISHAHESTSKRTFSSEQKIDPFP